MKTSSINLFRSSTTLCLAGLIGGLASSACDLPDKNLGDDPPTDPSGDECQEGDVSMQECNRCFCENGAWTCTEIGCEPGETEGPACDPATEPTPECGECGCVNGEWECTEIGCAPSQCEDGETYAQDCNGCLCEDGAWNCTEIGCPPNPPVAVCGGSEPADPHVVTGATISGDLLTVSVDYSGGCEYHWIGSCWDGMFREQDPPSTSLVINHESNGDGCEAGISDEFTVDLTSLREAYGQPNGTIVVEVGDWGAVDYVF